MTCWPGFLTSAIWNQTAFIQGKQEAHYGQLNVELTSIKKCLIHTSVRDVLKFFKRDAESTEQRGRINMDAIWATPYSMGKKFEAGCVWVLTKYFKTEDHTSRQRQARFCCMVLVTISVFILKRACSIMPTPQPWMWCSVSHLHQPFPGNGDETTYDLRIHLKATRELHGDLYLYLYICIFTKGEACSLRSYGMWCKQ